LLVIYNYQY